MALGQIAGVLHQPQLGTYAAKHGVMMADGLGVDLLERFKVEGIAGEERLGMNTKGCYTAALRAFLKYAYEREWIAKALHIA